jgi:hypothetical protein
MADKYSICIDPIQKSAALEKGWEMVINFL